jgi:hypothetical protein
VPLENFYSKIDKDQQNECLELLWKMGAKSIRIVTFDESKERKHGEGKVDSKTFGGHAGGSTAKEEQKYNEIAVSHGEGHSSELSPDVLKKSKWFDSNQDMEYILKMRLPKTGKLTEYKLTTEFNQKIYFDIDTAVNFLGKGGASLKADFEKVTNQKRELHIIFGEG